MANSDGSNVTGQRLKVTKRNENQLRQKHCKDKENFSKYSDESNAVLLSYHKRFVNNPLKFTILASKIARKEEIWEESLGKFAFRLWVIP